MMGEKFGKFRKIYIPLVVFFLLVFGLAAGVFLTRQRQEIRNKAAGEVVNLTLSPPLNLSVNPGDGVDFTVNANQSTAGFYNVTAAKIVINYPADYLTLNSITPGTYFKPANFSLSSQEMLALGVSCSQNSDCLTTATGVNCMANWCTNSNVSGNTSPVSGNAQAIFYLGVPCPVSGTSCMVQNGDSMVAGVGPIATLHFTVKNLGTTTATATVNINSTGTSMSQAAALLHSDNTEITTSVAGFPATGTSVNLTVNVGSTGNNGILPFKIRFPGIDTNTANCPTRQVRVILKTPGTNTEVLRSTITMTADLVTAIYSGTVSNIVPGTYDVYIKGPAHLQLVVSTPVTVSSITTAQDWTSLIIKAGDVAKSDQATGNIVVSPDNLIDLTDWQSLLNKTSLTTQVDPMTNFNDLNCDKYIDTTDLQMILGNVSLNYGAGEGE